MKKYVYSLCLALLLLLGGHLSAYQSAHAIAVSEWGFDSQGKPIKYVLLGLTKQGKLSDFGGFKDAGETDPKNTAAREIEEESIGVLGQRKDLRTMLKGKTAVNPGKPDHPHYVLPSKYYGNAVKEFRKRRFGKGARLSTSQKEMVDLVPVQVDELKKSLARGKPAYIVDKQGKKLYFRGATEGALRKAVALGEL